MAFNPVYIKVKAGGQEYDEMHVDGGVKAEVCCMKLPSISLPPRKGSGLRYRRPRKLYLIRMPGSSRVCQYKTHIGDFGTGPLAV